jgi:uncharacterized membrane protein YkvA (DUF1232 family)
MIEKIKNWANLLKQSMNALYLAYRHKNVPFLAKLVAIVTVSYALSPIDLIPDFIPILGLLDDLIVLPLGIALAIKLIPKDIWIECKTNAKNETLKTLPRSNKAAIVVILIWITVSTLMFYVFFKNL